MAESRADAGDVPADEYAFHFLSGRPSLDLVATIGERWRRAFERLREPRDLARWAVEAGLVEEAPRVLRRDLERARRLRAAIARVVFAWVDGRTLPARDVAVVNEAAARPGLVEALAVTGEPVVPVRASIGAVLSTVARDAIGLVTSGDPRRVRECGADDCSLLFWDASRPGRRRWCSMEGCGNRAKTSRYRQRHAVAR
ncbi:MAG: CGNR zinc finger domain-containing protein [Nitriliruptorales bacterium]|nr:CGNR zinc finger domain-containing protein [Nitriliruptorales bacterium]